jgi:hypothetical protein
LPLSLTGRHRFMRRSILPWMLLLAAVGCAEPVNVDKPRSEMSRRERDSTIANSGLYGAGVAKKAMDVADAEARRKAMMDSMSAH